MIEIELFKNKFEETFYKLKSTWPNQSQILLLGVTGTFGLWILNTIIFIESKIKSNNHYTIITRKSKKELVLKFPQIESLNFEILNLDIQHVNSEFTSQNNFEKMNYILFAADAVENETESKISNVEKLFSNMKLDKNFLKKIVYLSSGAIYQNNDSENTQEDSIDLKSIQTELENNKYRSVFNYAQNKLKSEKYLFNFANTNHIQIISLRCFSFVGPEISQKMALFSFMKAKIKNQNIEVNSPHSVRSYMNWSDLVYVILISLFKNHKINQNLYEAINVGSIENVTLEKLAYEINQIENNTSKVVVCNNPMQGLGGQVYYPYLNKFEIYFDNPQLINLKESLIELFNYYKLKEFSDVKV